MKYNVGFLYICVYFVTDNTVDVFVTDNLMYDKLLMSLEVTVFHVHLWCFPTLFLLIIMIKQPTVVKLLGTVIIFMANKWITCSLIMPALTRNMSLLGKEIELTYKLVICYKIRSCLFDQTCYVYQYHQIQIYVCIWEN